MRRDLACALTLLAVALLYYLLAADIGRSALADAVGPAGLPMVYAGVLAALAVLIGIGGLRREESRRDAAPTAGSVSADAAASRSEARTARRLTRAGGTLAIGVAYLAAAPVIGYPFAVAAVIAAMAAYQGERRPARIALVAAAGAAAFFVLFELVLGVAMPAPWNG